MGLELYQRLLVAISESLVPITSTTNFQVIVFIENILQSISTKWEYLSQSFDPEDCYMLVVLLFVVIDLAGSVIAFAEFAFLVLW